MATVEIPLVDPKTPIAEALEQMKLLGRNGVIFHSDAGWRLLYGGRLLAARDQGIDVVGRAEGGVSIASPQIGHGWEDEMVIRPTRRTSDKEFFAFPSESFEHLLESVNPVIATVLPARKVLASMPAEFRGNSLMKVPVVGMDIEIGRAVESMRVSQVPGLLVQRGETGDLLNMQLVESSFRLGGERIGEVRGGWPVRLVGREGLRLISPGISILSGQPTAYASLYGVTDELFRRYKSPILAAIWPRTARVVTAYEGLAQTLVGFALYKCTGIKKKDGQPHYFPEPSVQEGEVCPLYPECDLGPKSIIVAAT